jgi:hypothetical protein
MGESLALSRLSISSSFIEPEDLLLCYQELSTGSYPVPDEFSHGRTRVSRLTAAKTWRNGDHQEVTDAIKCEQTGI